MNIKINQLLSESTYTKFGLLDDIKVVVEVGSRDCRDAYILAIAYPEASIYPFEANPDAWALCEETLEKINNQEIRERIKLQKFAATDCDGHLIFRPFDLSKYNNIGASSIFEIDFITNRSKDDPDFGRTNVQKEVVVQGVRLDTWAVINKINKIDLLCMDVQGAELLVVQGAGSLLMNTKAIISETSISSTYKGGASFSQINSFLSGYNFAYHYSDKYGTTFPPDHVTGFSEFNAIWLRI